MLGPSIFTKINRCIAFLTTNSSITIDSKYLKLRLGLITAGVIGHYCYATTTKHPRHITITDKYQLIDFGFHKLMVVGDNDVHMAVPYSVWYNQFDAPEKWNNIEIGKTYNIETYGDRIPILHMFPNIIKYKEAND